jgi:hypothetical protein
VLFVSGAGNGAVSGNGGYVNAPATCYNGLGVAVIDGPSSIGPSRDNGRSKPDITAPGFGYTSFSAPYVAGAAAVLTQAGFRGDGGFGTTNSATDIRTLKALLLNGAVKPSDWTHTKAAPLDPRHGAGIVNVFNSYEQMAGGKHAAVETTTITSGGTHLPGSNTNNLSSIVGWDFATLSTTPNQDRIAHYYLSLTNIPSGAYTLTTTLVWNRQQNQTSINDLNLFLYNTANSNLVACSTSLVDNVEQLFIPQLGAGRYDLQILKSGEPGKRITQSEDYALAFETFTMPLSIVKAANAVVISWPIAPTGFVLQSTTNLTPPIVWQNVNASVTVTNNRNVVAVSLPAGNQFYRLRRP